MTIDRIARIFPKLFQVHRPYVRMPAALPGLPNDAQLKPDARFHLLCRFPPLKFFEAVFLTPQN
jgi:hypothetical protein